MTRIGGNGFGRIGRNFLRAAHARRPDLAVGAANGLGGDAVDEWGCSCRPVDLIGHLAARGLSA